MFKSEYFFLFCLHFSTYVNEPLGLTVEEAEANSPLSEEKVEIFVENLVDKNPDFRTMVVVAEYESPAFKLQGEKFSQVNVPIVKIDSNLVSLSLS